MRQTDRLPYQVLIFLRRPAEKGREYLILKRADLQVWQGVAGGGESSDDSPHATAKRELLEETGIEVDSITQLDSTTLLLTEDVVGSLLWGEDVQEIPEYSFVADMHSMQEVKLSSEHVDFKWCTLAEALTLLEWPSNKSAITEAAQLP